METKKKAKTSENKTMGDAKGKATFDQNGKGDSPKYGQAGQTPNESGEGMKEKTDKTIDKS
jgi:hypothetical protein